MAQSLQLGDLVMHKAALSRSMRQGYRSVSSTTRERGKGSAGKVSVWREHFKDSGQGSGQGQIFFFFLIFRPGLADDLPLNFLLAAFV
jgi:hypothetical protein